MAAVSSTIENYLKQILLLSQDCGSAHVGMGILARRMQVVPGTATTMVKSMAKSGWLLYEPRTGVKLTDNGEELALQVLRKHRIVEMFLVEVLDIDWAEIHAEAEMLEHAISDKLLRRMDSFLGHPTVDPHGDPIPGPTGQMLSRQLLPLADCTPGCTVRISRIKQQDANFLRFLHDSGLRPGTGLTVISQNDMADMIEVLPADSPHPIRLGSKAASHILVEQLIT